MNCIRVRTCCFMCSVTTGSKIFGWVITLASAAGIIYVAATFNDLLPMPIAIATLCFLALVLFGGVVLLVGIYSESSNAVLGALIILVLIFLGAIALSIPFTEGYITGTLPLVKSLPAYIGIILIILITGYILLVVNSYRLEKVDELLALYAPGSIAVSDEEIIVVNRPNYGWPPAPGPAKAMVHGATIKQPDGFRYDKNNTNATELGKFSRHVRRHGKPRNYYPTQSYAIYRPIYRRAVLTGEAKPTQGLFGQYELKYKPPEGTYY